MSSTTEHGFSEAVLNWWSFIVFLVTLATGFILGHAKRGWTIEQLQAKLQALEARLTELETSTDKDSRTLIRVASDTQHIKEALNEIKQRLERMS